MMRTAVSFLIAAVLVYLSLCAVLFFTQRSPPSRRILRISSGPKNQRSRLHSWQIGR